MRYKLVYPESYIRRARKFIRKNTGIAGSYRKTLELLELNPFHPSLRLHKLRGSPEGLSSVSINISYRIVILMIIREQEIILIDVGKHDQVY